MKRAIFVLTERRRSPDSPPDVAALQRAVTTWLIRALRR